MKNKYVFVVCAICSLMAGSAQALDSTLIKKNGQELSVDAGHHVKLSELPEYVGDNREFKVNNYSFLMAKKEKNTKDIAFVVDAGAMRWIGVVNGDSHKVSVVYSVYGGRVLDIHWSPSGSKLALDIVDASGKRNLVIVDGEYKIGLRDIFSTPDNYPADVIFYRWIDNNNVEFNHVPSPASMDRKKNASVNGIKKYIFSIRDRVLVDEVKR